VWLFMLVGIGWCGCDWKQVIVDDGGILARYFGNLHEQ
jgi:hypothetical protein